MDDKRTLGMGNVVVHLVNGTGTEELVLRPTIAAMRNLSRRHGGLNPLVDKIGKLDFDVIVEVLEAGLGMSGGNPREKERLSEKVYATGLTDDTGGLPLLCIQYVTVLMRGGRPPPAPGAAEEVVSSSPNPQTGP